MIDSNQSKSGEKFNSLEWTKQEPTVVFLLKGEAQDSVLEFDCDTISRKGGAGKTNVRSYKIYKKDYPQNPLKNIWGRTTPRIP